MTAERKFMNSHKLSLTKDSSQHPSRKRPLRTTMVGCGTRWREKGGGGALPLPQAQAATWAALPLRRGKGLLPLAISLELGTKVITKMRAAPAHRTGKTTKKGPAEEETQRRGGAGRGRDPGGRARGRPGEQRPGEATERPTQTREQLTPISAEHQLGVAKLQQRAALLPQPRGASPLGATTLRLRAGGRQHAEEADGLLRRAPPVFEGQRH